MTVVVVLLPIEAASVSLNVTPDDSLRNTL